MGCSTRASARLKRADETASAVGGTVVVHVEPDMWGYLEPGGLKQSVSVASSGNTDLASLPNTAGGLQQAYTGFL